MLIVREQGGLPIMIGAVACDYLMVVGLRVVKTMLRLSL